MWEYVLAVLPYQFHECNIKKLLLCHLASLVLGDHNQFLPAGRAYGEDHDALRSKLIDQVLGFLSGCCGYHYPVIRGMFYPAEASVTKFEVDVLIPKGIQPRLCPCAQFLKQLNGKHLFGKLSKKYGLVSTACPDLQDTVGLLELKLFCHIDNEAWLADCLSEPYGQRAVKFGQVFVLAVDKA